jgi:hypothetical protein
MARLQTPSGALALDRYELLMSTHWLRVAIVAAYGLLAVWKLAKSARDRALPAPIILNGAGCRRPAWRRLHRGKNTSTRAFRRESWSEAGRQQSPPRQSQPANPVPLRRKTSPTHLPLVRPDICRRCGWDRDLPVARGLPMELALGWLGNPPSLHPLLPDAPVSIVPGARTLLASRRMVTEPFGHNQRTPSHWLRQVTERFVH